MDNVSKWGDERGLERGSEFILLFPGIPVPIYETLRVKRTNQRSRKFVNWRVKHGDYVFADDVIAEFSVEPVPSQYEEDIEKTSWFEKPKRKMLTPQVTAFCEGRISIGDDEFAEWPNPAVLSKASLDERERLKKEIYKDKRNIFFAIQRPVRDDKYIRTGYLYNVYQDVVKYCYSLYRKGENQTLKPELEMLANAANIAMLVKDFLSS